jgi:hypothetical protein
MLQYQLSVRWHERLSSAINLKGLEKEAVVFYIMVACHPVIRLKGQKKTVEHLRQDGLCPDRD